MDDLKGTDTPLDTPDASEQQPATPPETQDAEHKEAEPGTSKETKPEFDDPNMQQRWTEKTTELANQRKELESRLAQYEKDATFYRTLKQNQDLVKLIQDYYTNKGKPADKPAVKELPKLTDNDILEATTNPDKFQTLIDTRARFLAEQLIAEKLAPLEEKLGATSAEIQESKRVSIIEAFGKEHPDFWDLDADGKGPIVGYLKMLEGNSNLSYEQKLDMAYKLAKMPTLEQNAIKKAHKIVDDKKRASADKGGGDITSFKKKDARTWEEALQEEADKLKWE